MAESTTATATISTYLMKFDGVTARPVKSDISKAKKVCDIKTVPAMGGEPETIETTPLSDEMQTTILGVQANESKEFTSNYVPSVYKELKKLEGDESIWWGVFLGKSAAGVPDGHDGIFTWQGGITSFLSEGEVNGVREVTSYISCATSVELMDQSGA